MAANFSMDQGSLAAATERSPKESGTPVQGIQNAPDDANCCGLFEVGTGIGNSRRGWNG